MFYFLGKSLGTALFTIIFRIEVSGAGNIPLSGGFILASNHASFLDPVALGVASPRRLSFMAQHDLFFNPLFSRLISNLGAFAVRQGAPDLAAFKEAIRRINQGAALVIFPEGRRVPKGEIAEPGAGVGFLAQKLNVPVIPAFIKGTEVALPKGARFIRPTKVAVHFGKQILVERRVPYEEIAQQIMQEIRRLS